MCVVIVQQDLARNFNEHKNTLGGTNTNEICTKKCGLDYPPVMSDSQLSHLFAKIWLKMLRMTSICQKTAGWKLMRC